MTEQQIDQFSSVLSETDIDQVEDLKQQALSLIQKICDQTWTDHNTSDPGITILEVLAFVIHELSCRLALPINDLLLPNPELSPALIPFFKPEQLLPSNPVTLADRRRSLIDIPGVKNVDLHRRTLLRDTNDPTSVVTTGLFDIVIDLEDELLLEPNEDILNARKTALLNIVQQHFIRQRNVNEDIGSIRIVPKQLISLGMTVSIEKSIDPMDVVSELFTKISENIAPSVKKYRYDDLVKQGITGDEIFDGPLLCQGFIKANDVDSLSMPSTLYASDILSALDGIGGLKYIKNFHFMPLSPISDGGVVDDSLRWRIDIPSGFIASLDVIKTYTLLTLDIDGQPFPLPTLNNQQQAGLIKNKTIEQGNGVPQALTTYISGRYRNLQQYSSLQHQLPKLYGMTENRLNGPILEEEIAVILQLKGYLTVFDQVLADQFAQLEVLKNLLALPNHEVFFRLSKTFTQMLSSESLTSNDVICFWSDIRMLPQTQRSQAIEDISGMGRLLGDYFDQYNIHAFQAYAEPVFSKVQLDRLKRSFEHLFSRFSETSLDVTLLKYKDVFNHYLPIIQCAKNALPVDIHKLVSLKQTVDLVMLINDYPAISELRTGGFNYLSKEPKSHHFGGLSRRIMRFIGLSKLGQIPLATNNKEGIYLIESELIRFGAYLNTPDGRDIYEPNQLYFIAPAWPTRFANSEFRSLLEQQIVKDSPVFQQPHIIYLCREEMSLFERLYFAWLNAMTQLPFVREPTIQSNGMKIDAEQSTLVTTLSTLLRRFFELHGSILSLILHSFSVNELREKITFWLQSEEEALQLNENVGDVSTNDMIDVLQKNFHNIVYARYLNSETSSSTLDMNSADSMNSTDNMEITGHIESGENEAADTIDAELNDVKQEVERVTYQILFTICQQQLDIIARPKSIKHGVIGSSFKVGYRPLKYLKPAHPIGNATINSNEIEDSAFTLGIKHPLVI